MDMMMICMLLTACGLLAANGAMVAMIWTALHRDHIDRTACREPAGQELPEEQEARRLAAEAQRYYEQGFVNLMQYDGSPGRKERERP